MIDPSIISFDHFSSFNEMSWVRGKRLSIMPQFCRKRGKFAARASQFHRFDLALIDPQIPKFPILINLSCI